ncbi:MAG: ABC transporter ATP-binding protein [Peptococcaceae bacterium]|nr:ABC transporter ATP-binding protein [Peptococcaceae bacterium]
MLEVKELVVCHGYVRALNRVSLHAAEGELLAVLGANGAGKSTLLGAIAGLYRPVEGEIRLCGRATGGSPPEAVVRRGISLVPERREIFNTLTVLDNLLLGAYHRRLSKDALRKEARDVLEIFPALKGREGDPAGSLSGGLQQMLAIGRGLMAGPRVLLLDEPSVGLAPLVVREIMSTLRQLKEKGVAIILVEQNTGSALKVADRALVMERGRVVLSGSSGDMLDDCRVRQAYLGGGPAGRAATVTA